MDKRARATLFRDRLTRGIQDAGLSQAGLARAIGADRSTVSQLLAASGARLPNAQIIAECAAALGVSADWLLGLSDRPDRAATLVAAAISLAEADRALVDERIFGWHREAEGYKIRHVPTGLPDMLKTPDVLRWEYEPSLGRTIDQAIAAAEARLDWMRSARSDYEMAVPLHELAAFAEGSGYYAGLPPDARAHQFRTLIELSEQLYPRLRLFLYDARRLYSVPVTVFGPLLAVIYVGRTYLVFRDTERIGALTAHFDHLVREAAIGDRDLPAHLRRLMERGIAHDPDDVCTE